MDKLPPPYDVLSVTRHAESRMQSRSISLYDVQRAIQRGCRVDRGINTLHYDKDTWVGVVINWHSRTIVTVMNVWLVQPQPDPNEHVTGKGLIYD